eukprot:TRINITY_DN14337_c0_g1_i1.p1 TRINITY_DN14337_c0_g1~~TRINITY_DN14337_c0_g1_i1.p1  ORF type:complete len:198 (+),score=35.99 TRINITY_DN14337_c0_g1_i1:57-650(+)
MARRKRKGEENVFKLVVAGPAGVEKRALILQFMYGDFVQDYDPTFADHVIEKRVVNGTLCTVDILDTAGVEDYAAMNDMNYQEGEGFIVVYSMTSSHSAREVKEFYERILRAAQARDLEPENVPFVLCANKCDLKERREVDRAEGMKLAEVFNFADYFETSAKENISVQDAFSAIIAQIAAARETDKKSGKRRCVIC